MSKGTVTGSGFANLMAMITAVVEATNNPPSAEEKAGAKRLATDLGFEDTSELIEFVVLKQREDTKQPEKTEPIPPGSAITKTSPAEVFVNIYQQGDALIGQRHSTEAAARAARGTGTPGFVLHITRDADGEFFHQAITL